MSILTIDTKQWATAKTLAKEHGWDGLPHATQKVTTIVNRHNIATWSIKLLGIRLIDRNQFNNKVKEISES